MVILLEEQIYLVCMPSVSDNENLLMILQRKFCTAQCSVELVSKSQHLALLSLLLPC